MASLSLASAYGHVDHYLQYVILKMTQLTITLTVNDLLDSTLKRK